MEQQVEIILNEDTGKAIIHPKSGFGTHAEEHAMIDQLIAQLRALGWDVEVNHYHDHPKIPQTEDPVAPPQDKTKKGGD